MSESIEVSTPTADIAASVIETAEAPTSEPVIESTPAPAAEPELSPAAKFLVSQGHKWGKRPDGKTDLAFLPASTVEKMLDRYADTHRLTWDGEKKTLSEQLQEMREALTEQRTLIGGDPKNYLAELAKFDQRYSSFLQPAAPPPPPPVVEMPGPDVDLGNGSKTYSVEGIQKLIEWAVDAKMLPKVDERLKPLTEREAAEKARAEQSQRESAVRERVSKVMSEAQTWPMFGTLAEDGSLTPFQQEVLDAFKADKSLTLHQAYMKAFMPRYAEDDTKRRERLLKEQSEAAKSTPTVARTGAEVAKVPAAAQTRDIAAKILDQMDR